MTCAQAADEPSWSTGVYRLDPGRNPFQTPGEKPRTEMRDQWWNQDRAPRRSQEPFTPRIWDKETESQPAVRKNRPWGEIPYEGEEAYPPGRERPAYSREGRPAYEERYQQRAPQSQPGDPERDAPRNRYWEGPYQRENTREYDPRERYDRDRDYPDSGYRDGYYRSERAPSWSGRRYRSDSWDPWERDPLLSPWER